MHRTLVGILAALAACATAGCWLPSYRRSPDARLHVVEQLPLAQSQAAPLGPGPPSSAAPYGWGTHPPEELPSPSSAPDLRPPTVELQLDEARAAALAHNLDLRVQLVNPEIADQVVHEELARFQATFRAAIGHNQTDPPAGNFLFGAQQRQTVDLVNPFAPAGFGDPASSTVEVPLTTGGRLSLDSGLGRLDPAGSDEVHDTHLGFSFSQPLLRGAGRNVTTAAIQIADLQNGVAGARTKLAVIRALADVERAYWNLYGTLKLREIAQQQIGIAERQLHIARRLIQADQISQVDGLRAESGLYARQSLAIVAETDVRLAARELKRIMQRPDLPVDSPEPLLVATDPAPVALQLDRQILSQYAIQNRMEMLELELDLLRNAVLLAVEENGVLPQLDVTGRYALLGSDRTLGGSYERLFGDGFNDWFVGLVGEVPLPLGSGNRAAVARRAQATLERYQTRISQDRLHVLIRQDVHNAVDQIELNWRRILAARQAVLAAEKTYQAEVRLFEQGQRDSTDVLFAAERLADVQTQEVRALVDSELAKVDLAVATGTMLGFGQVIW